MEVKRVKMVEIFADPEFNCRGKIIPMDVIELAKDIDDNGLLSPIMLQPYNFGGYKYRIIAGHRRHMAHIVLKKDEIDALIRDDLTDLQARIFNLSENLKRTDLTLYEESLAIKKLVDIGLTEDGLAKRIGKPRGWVQVRRMVLKLPLEIQAEIKAGLLTQQNVRDVYSLNGKLTEQFDLVKKIKEAKFNGKSTNIRNAKSRNKPAKRQRKKNELLALSEYLAKLFGYGLTTRSLAWASGEIDDEDLIETISQYADKYGVNYEKPTDGIIPIIGSVD